MGRSVGKGVRTKCVIYSVNIARLESPLTHTIILAGEEKML